MCPGVLYGIFQWPFEPAAGRGEPEVSEVLEKGEKERCRWVICTCDPWLVGGPLPMWLTKRGGAWTPAMLRNPGPCQLERRQPTFIYTAQGSSRAGSKPASQGRTWQGSHLGLELAFPLSHAPSSVSPDWPLPTALANASEGSTSEMPPRVVFSSGLRVGQGMGTGQLPAGPRIPPGCLLQDALWDASYSGS